MPSLLAVQTHPELWPDEPLSWKPRRWIVSSPDPESSAHPPLSEKLFQPAQSTYFPWSLGKQDCPGSRFSQVEFVAVLARLLREHRLEVVRASPDEALEAARARVLAVTEDCDLELLLRMKDAERVQIKCAKV